MDKGNREVLVLPKARKGRNYRRKGEKKKGGRPEERKGKHTHTCTHPQNGMLFHFLTNQNTKTVTSLGMMKLQYNNKSVKEQNVELYSRNILFHCSYFVL